VDSLVHEITELLSSVKQRKEAEPTKVFSVGGNLLLQRGIAFKLVSKGGCFPCSFNRPCELTDSVELDMPLQSVKELIARINWSRLGNPEEIERLLTAVRAALEQGQSASMITVTLAFGDLKLGLDALLDQVLRCFSRRNVKKPKDTGDA